MFTGLIEAIGQIADVKDAGGLRRLRVQTALAHELAVGDSVAVNGVCLTVTELKQRRRGVAGDREQCRQVGPPKRADKPALARRVAPRRDVAGDGADGQMCADIGPETLRVTTLGSLHPEQLVNLERAMRADGRFGGHFVQGHVDGIGTVQEVRTDADARWLTIGFPRALAPYVVRKGSIAVDGISLTVAGLGDDRFDVMIVPFTWAHTSLPAVRVGSQVNLECDLVGKYVARAVELFK